ncbi:MAG: hypothetical protein O3A53_11915 [Acidobacteria bacterium]|nr:hypothetical protein [Acidobacteriota bacterium]MDA1235498.1 hypothetical protein [Acidobacteriota bacterium]
MSRTLRSRTYVSLPKEKILIEADMFDPPAPGQSLADDARPLNEALLLNVERIGLEVETVAPIHGPATSWTEAVRLMNRQ